MTLVRASATAKICVIALQWMHLNKPVVNRELLISTQCLTTLGIAMVTALPHLAHHPVQRRSVMCTLLKMIHMVSKEIVSIHSCKIVRKTNSPCTFSTEIDIKQSYLRKQAPLAIRVSGGAITTVWRNSTVQVNGHFPIPFFTRSMENW